MNNWMREVDYATYCPKCKNFKENNGLLYEVNSYLKGDIYYEKSMENWY